MRMTLSLDAGPHFDRRAAVGLIGQPIKVDVPQRNPVPAVVAGARIVGAALVLELEVGEPPPSVRVALSAVEGMAVAHA